MKVTIGVMGSSGGGLSKETGACVIYDDDPAKLVDRLIQYYRTEHFRRPSCFCGGQANR